MWNNFTYIVSHTKSFARRLNFFCSWLENLASSALYFVKLIEEYEEKIKYTNSLQNLYTELCIVWCNKIDNVLEEEGIFTLIYRILHPHPPKWLSHTLGKSYYSFSFLQKAKAKEQGSLRREKETRKPSGLDLKVKIMRIGNNYTVKFSDGLNPAENSPRTVYWRSGRTAFLGLLFHNLSPSKFCLLNSLLQVLHV